MTAEEAKDKYRTARRMNLSGYWLLRNTERAVRECNGIGAEWFPGWLRWVISHLFPHLTLAADIHDIRYYIGGSYEDRCRYDAEFLTNCYMIIEYVYPWYLYPVRFGAEFIARRMHKMLRIGGRTACNE